MTRKRSRVDGSIKCGLSNILGNDYLVVEEQERVTAITSANVKRICDRHFGIDSDGVLVLLPTSEGGLFSLQILDPDGTEAEKSGNGRRIFARYLWDRGYDLLHTCSFA
jgi:diaminopimelate epimerase